MKIVQIYLSISKMYFFLFLISIVLAITYIQLENIIPLSVEKMDMPETLKQEFIRHSIKYSWASYLGAILIVMLRILYTTICLYIGSILFAGYDSLCFNKSLNVALKADLLLVLYSLFTVLLIMHLGVDDGQSIVLKTSLAGLANVESIESWILMIMGAFNLFELLYWMLLSLFVSAIIKRKFVESFSFILSTYGLGFLLYLLMMVFITLYITK